MDIYLHVFLRPHRLLVHYDTEWFLKTKGKIERNSIYYKAKFGSVKPVKIYMHIKKTPDIK